MGQQVSRNATDDRWLLNRARELRPEQAPAEVVLWRELRGRRLTGFKFRRQNVVGEYVVDFYCAACKLVIELDGETHTGKEAADRVRQSFLESRGLKVLRFWNTDVYDNLDGVLSVILRECAMRG